MQIDEQKIDDVMVNETVGDIAENAGDEQPDAACARGDRRRRRARVAMSSPTSVSQREHDEEPVVVAPDAEGGAGVRPNRRGGTTAG